MLPSLLALQTGALVPLTSLWVPIVLSAIVVWILSAIFWTASPHHKKDWGGLPSEDRVLGALRDAGAKPGHYMFPWPADQAQWKSPEFQQKLDQGPVGLTIIQTADTRRAMGKAMGLSFVFNLVVSFFVAYLASRTLMPGTDYLAVFRVTGTAAFLAYGMGVIPDTIWFGRGWTQLWKHLGDALVYALFTAGMFGWRWPTM